MLKHFLPVSLLITGAFALAGCHIDDSFSTSTGPVYSTGSQVTPGNRSIGQQPVVSTGSRTIGSSPFRSGDVYTQGGVVTTSAPSASTTGSVIAVQPPASMRHAAPVAAAPAPVPVVVQPDDEPVVRSSPSVG